MESMFISRLQLLHLYFYKLFMQFCRGRFILHHAASYFKIYCYFIITYSDKLQSLILPLQLGYAISMQLNHSHCLCAPKVPLSVLSRAGTGSCSSPSLNTSILISSSQWSVVFLPPQTHNLHFPIYSCQFISHITFIITILTYLEL